MSQHVPDDLLSSFVEGDVGEQLAIHIAEHLDACPACGTRAAGLEPLAVAFASVDDPDPPAELAARVLALADEPDRVPVVEIGIGGGLLVVSALLATQGNPVGMVADLGLSIDASRAILRALMTGLAHSGPALLVMCAVTIAGCVATIRLADPTPFGRLLSVNRRFP